MVAVEEENMRFLSLTLEGPYIIFAIYIYSPTRYTM